MSFLKKPFRKLKEKNASPSSSNTDVTVPPSKEEGLDGAFTPQNGTGGHATPTGSKRQSSEKKRQSVDKARPQKLAQSLARVQDEKFLQEAPPELTALYRPYSMNQSKHWRHDQRVLFKDVDFAQLDGQIITFRARMHTLRRMSAKLVFIVFRQQTITIQGVLQSRKSTDAMANGVKEETDASEPVGTISEHMVRTVEHYPSETIVVVHAKVRKAVQHVKNATIHDYEFEVYEVHRVTELAENVPFTVYDAENINRDKEDKEELEEDDESVDNLSLPSMDPMSPASRPMSVASPPPMSPISPAAVALPQSPRPSEDVGRAITDRLGSKNSLDHARGQRSLPQRVRLNNRIVDLRTAPSQSIFRIQSGICNLFRSYLDDQGFIEIHTPKLQGGATESGATVFELNYFGRPAFLAQSPQLAKQMCIAADFERVYEVGPVFRAEDSNTPRHLTEYTGLDLEMALEEHYHEALDIIDGMFKNLWKGIYDRYQHEIDIISQFYPHHKVEWLEETPRIPFAKGIQMLKDDGWVDEDGNPPSEWEDLATRAELRLGQLVKQKFKTDYYILDKFPASARPFYTMPDPSDDRITNSFDIFMRGQEIVSGGQRIHDAHFLEKKLKKNNIRPDTMSEYLEGFRWGAPPHAGCGVGLERLTYLFLNLGNIRLASLFPRDPKSLPAHPPITVLRHEEASTTNPPWDNPEIDPASPEAQQIQPLEKLIANYGDAANTSWLDKRYHVWRDPSTGAAQGYVIHGTHAVIVGEPLCDKSQRPQVISTFLQYLRNDHKELKPIWMIIGAATEEYLAEKFQWRTIACIAEERCDPRFNPAVKDNDFARKIRHAEKEGVKSITHPFQEPIPEDVKAKIDARIVDWQKNRKGKQVHLTEIRPWFDEHHRRYFYAQTTSADGSTAPEGKIHAIVVLHQLAPENGYQIKFSLEFPGAPSGTIEALLLHAFRSLVSADSTCTRVTFGTGALNQIEGGRNIGSYRLKALKKAYEGIVKQMNVKGKSEFREKMGTTKEGVYVAYPRGGLGAGGIKALMGFLGEDGE